VVKRAFGTKEINAKQIHRLQRSVERIRYIFFLAFPEMSSKRFQSNLEEYIKILRGLYKAIIEVSGAKVLIDSSKAPQHGLILSLITDIDLSVIHLIRDSRAVVYSWQRKKKRPEIYWKEEYMPRYGLLKAVGEWFLHNKLAELLKKRASQYLLVRYEDLVERPRTSVANILHQLGFDNADLGFFHDERIVELEVDHTVSGNPLRFEQGMIEISPDLEWEQRLPALDRIATTILTYPLLRKYGICG